MPVQHTIFGRPVNFRAPPRRIQIVLFIFGFITFCMIVFGPPTSADLPTASGIKDTLIHPGKIIPTKYNPLGPPVHKPPPEQANSTSGEARWYSDWTWRNPFSSSVTLDENRAVLPPFKTRTPIYTYYEPTSKDVAVQEAENKLILTWRRAWWAQGFRPAVLGRAEAMQNPLYEQLQRAGLNGNIETEMARWLAWGTMGTGILANWLALPMAPREDPMFTFLRHGEYPKLTRWEGLETGIVVGEKNAINNAIKIALLNPKIKDAKTMIDGIGEDAPAETFVKDKDADAIAYYDHNIIVTKYKDIFRKFEAKEDAKGYKMLAQLINSHLHLTWQNTFRDGINVVKPVPTHMTALVAPAVDLARNLTQCPVTPLPASCPPNRPKCTPCVSNTPLPVQLLPGFRNKTTLYNIGTVPHPWTFQSLAHQKQTIDIKFIRRDIKERDQWLMAATKELLGTSVSAERRVVRFKDAVASDFSEAHSLWLTAERESDKDLDWIFGFEVPREAMLDGKSETPVPGPERRPPPPKPEGKPPTELELKDEEALLKKARDALNSRVKDMVKLREAIEAWNLGDAESWKFARAFSARRRVERLKWEEEEQKFAGAEKGRRTQGWGRWFDKF